MKKIDTINEDTFSHATQYAEAGVAVIPVWWLENGRCACNDPQCARGNWGKHPILSNWPHKATTDKAVIQRWAQRWPRAHIGILPPEGHTIIDVDPRNGGDLTLKKLLGTQRVPRTPTQNSGGGGYHILFKGEPAGPLGKGIDVKRPGRG